MGQANAVGQTSIDGSFSSAISKRLTCTDFIEGMTREKCFALVLYATASSLGMSPVDSNGRNGSINTSRPAA